MLSLLAVFGVLAGCSSPDPVAEQDPPPPTREPVWAVELPEGAGVPELAAVAGDLVVVAAREAVVALERGTGSVRWRHPMPEAFSHEGPPIYLTDDAVVEFSGHPSRDTTVYDLATGAPRFTVPGDAREWVVPTRDALLVAQCEIREVCSLAARDLRTGATTWQLPLDLTGTEYVSQLPERAFVMPERLDRTLGRPVGANDLVEPMRAAPRGLLAVRGALSETPDIGPVPVSTVDVNAGAVLSTWSVDGLHSEPDRLGYYIGDLLVDSPNTHQPGGDVRVYDVRAGTLRWSRTLTAKSYRGRGGALDSNEFRPAIVDTPAGPALLTLTPDERPQVIDLASGAVRWTGDVGVILLGLDGPIAIARDRGGRGDLVGLDASTGARRWSTPLPTRRGGGEPYELQAWAVVGGRLVSARFGRETGVVRRSGQSDDGDRYDLRVQDLGSGALLWASDQVGLLGAGPDWIVAGGSPDGSSRQVRLYLP